MDFLRKKQKKNYLARTKLEHFDWNFHYKLRFRARLNLFQFVLFFKLE